MSPWLILLSFPSLFCITKALFQPPVRDKTLIKDGKMNLADIEKHLGKDAKDLLGYQCKGISKDSLHIPGNDWVDRIFASHRPEPEGLEQSPMALFHRAPGRHAATFPSFPWTKASSIRAGASFAKNPIYFDAENIVKLAIEGGCNAVASTLGVLGMTSRKYAHKIPYIVKLNHNELLTYPNKATEFYFGTAKQAYEMGAAGIGATVYFGSDTAQREIEETTKAFREAHELGMFTVLWCYIRNKAFKTQGEGFPPVRRPDRPGQPPGRHHRGRHHQAEIAGEQRRASFS